MKIKNLQRAISHHTCHHEKKIQRLTKDADGTSPFVRLALEIKVIPKHLFIYLFIIIIIIIRLNVYIISILPDQLTCIVHGLGL